MSRQRTESVDTEGGRDSVFDESVYEPDAVDEEDAIIRPTMTSPSHSVDDGENRRLERNRRSHMSLEKQIHGVGTHIGIPPNVYPHSSLPEFKDLDVDDEDEKLRRVKSAYASDGRKTSLTQGGYLRNSPRYHADLQFQNQCVSYDNRSNYTAPNFNGIPVVAVTATAVSNEDDSMNLDKISKETKKNTRVIKILILLVLILLSVASVTAYLFLKDQRVEPPLQETGEVPATSDSDSNDTVERPTSQFPSESLTQKSSLPSKPLSPTPKPTSHPIARPSSIPSSSPPTESRHPTSAPTTLAPTVTLPCQPWCAANPNPWYDPDPFALQKCRFPKTCAGCPECDDSAIFPPAGNHGN